MGDGSTLRDLSLKSSVVIVPDCRKSTFAFLFPTSPYNFPHLSPQGSLRLADAFATKFSPQNQAHAGHRRRRLSGMKLRECRAGARKPERGACGAGVRGGGTVHQDAPITIGHVTFRGSLVWRQSNYVQSWFQGACCPPVDRSACCECMTS